MRSVIVAFFMAGKSIARGNIGVTLLTIAMLTLANLNLLFEPSLINGIVHSANDKLVDTFSGNIIIEPVTANTQIENPTIRNADELISRIKGIPGVEGVSARNMMSASFALGEERAGAVVRAVSPEAEKTVFKIADAIVEGSYLEPRDLDQIVLGIQVAGADRPNLEFYSASLKRAHAGDKVSVTWGNGIKKQYTIKGIYYTEFVQTDVQAFVTDLEFRSVNPNVSNRAATLNVRTAPAANPQQIISQIAGFRDGLRFKTWQDAAGIITSMTDSFAAINGILTFVNLLVAGITVFIVTYIDLTNKRRQIGIQRAIGISPVSITMSYVLRALFCAVVANILSWALYTYAVVPIEAMYPFHFPFGDISLYASNDIILRTAIIVLVVAVGAAFIPVRRAISVKILDAIWG